MKQLAALFLLAVTTGAAAVPIEQAVEVCRAEANALRRLSCYDSIATNTNTTSSAITATNATIAESPVPTNSVPENTITEQNSENIFGMEHKQNTELMVDKIYATVKTVSKTIHKELIIEFTNGQVWLQKGNDYYPVKPGDKHYIKRGALGAFFLGNDDSNRAIRVKREQ